jgi:hypothetical protein
MPVVMPCTSLEFFVSNMTRDNFKKIREELRHGYALTGVSLKSIQVILVVNGRFILTDHINKSMHCMDHTHSSSTMSDLLFLLAWVGRWW